MFNNAVARLSIGSLDDMSLSVDAHYNPKELQLQLQVPWATRSLTARAQDSMEVEFTGAQPQTLTLEMLFDCYERLQDDERTIEQLVGVLKTLAAVRDTSPDADAEHRRPHYCIVTWGDRGIQPLRCVIENLDVKYTMFDTKGLPLRAICNVKVREATLTGDFKEADKQQEQKTRERMADRARNQGR
jgi:hypothetical protein